jgi:gluconolactonase
MLRFPPSHATAYIVTLAATLSLVALASCTDSGNETGDGNGGSSTGGGSGTGPMGGTAGALGGTSGVATGGNAGTAPTGGVSGTAGVGTGGVSGTSGAAGAPLGGGAGIATGGAGGATGGSATGGAGTGGAAGAGGGGAGGGAGGSGGGSGGLYTCPSGVTGSPLPSNPMVTRVAGVPSQFGTSSSSNVEGPVWIGGSLYVSHLQEGVTNPPPSRILKITGMTEEVFVPDAGTNGLAVNAMGAIVGARHSAGDVATLNMTSKAFTPIAGQYMSARFDSPNDLVIRRDGNIYFSDPDFQAPTSRPQTQTRVYRIDPQGAVSVVDATIGNPNGIALSLDQNTLYVSTGGQLFTFPVMTDGTVGMRTQVNGAPGSDGMTLDCGGNLYLTDGNNHRVVVLTPTLTMLGTISTGIPNEASPTNVAFGGDNHQRLFITTRGSGNNGAGLYYVDLNIPGMPY